MANRNFKNEADESENAGGGRIGETPDSNIIGLILKFFHRKHRKWVGLILGVILVGYGVFKKSYQGHSEEGLGQSHNGYFVGFNFGGTVYNEDVNFDAANVRSSFPKEIKTTETAIEGSTTTKTPGEIEKSRLDATNQIIFPTAESLYQSLGRPQSPMIFIRQAHDIFSQIYSLALSSHLGDNDTMDWEGVQVHTGLALIFVLMVDYHLSSDSLLNAADGQIMLGRASVKQYRIVTEELEKLAQHLPDTHQY